MVDGTSPDFWRAASTSPPVVSALARNRRLRAVHLVGEVGSTQDVARELAAQGAPDGTVVVAERQTAGRGRRGRRWEDAPPGGGLALTLLLDLGHGALASGLVPHALGVAVHEACAPMMMSAVTLGLKWPNDVLARSDATAAPRKLAGVLVERERIPGATPREVLLCGVGLNVSLGGPPSSDRVDLTSLATDPPERGRILAALLEALDASLALLVGAPEDLLARYRAICETIGRAVVVEGAGAGPLAGTAVGVDADGRLLVSRDGTIHAILSGTVRGPEEAG